MFRSIDVVMVAVLIAIVSWTFKVKHDSQIALERVAELERLIAGTKTEIDLLKSDWSLLTSPARLQELVERYGDELNLEPMQPGQIAAEDELPGYRAERVRSPMFEQSVEADRTITTGSIKVPVE